MIIEAHNQKQIIPSFRIYWDQINECYLYRFLGNMVAFVSTNHKSKFPDKHMPISNGIDWYIQRTCQQKQWEEISQEVQNHAIAYLEKFFPHLLKREVFCEVQL